MVGPLYSGLDGTTECMFTVHVVSARIKQLKEWMVELQRRILGVQGHRRRGGVVQGQRDVQGLARASCVRSLIFEFISRLSQ